MVGGLTEAQPAWCGRLHLHAHAGLVLELTVADLHHQRVVRRPHGRGVGDGDGTRHRVHAEAVVLVTAEDAVGELALCVGVGGGHTQHLHVLIGGQQQARGIHVLTEARRRVIHVQHVDDDAGGHGGAQARGAHVHDPHRELVHAAHLAVQIHTCTDRARVRVNREEVLRFGFDDGVVQQCVQILVPVRRLDNQWCVAVGEDDAAAMCRLADVAHVHRLQEDGRVVVLIHDVHQQDGVCIRPHHVGGAHRQVIEGRLLVVKHRGCVQHARVRVDAELLLTAAHNLVHHGRPAPRQQRYHEFADRLVLMKLGGVFRLSKLWWCIVGYGDRDVYFCRR